MWRFMNVHPGCGVEKRDPQHTVILFNSVRVLCNISKLSFTAPLPHFLGPSSTLRQHLRRLLPVSAFASSTSKVADYQNRTLTRNLSSSWLHLNQKQRQRSSVTNGYNKLWNPFRFKREKGKIRSWLKLDFPTPSYKVLESDVVETFLQTQRPATTLGRGWCHEWKVQLRIPVASGLSWVIN